MWTDTSRRRTMVAVLCLLSIVLGALLEGTNGRVFVAVGLLGLASYGYAVRSERKNG